MSRNSAQFGTREKLILTGLFLSKFDESGLKELGFETFTEAFNVIGYALGGKPASIKNYRDEFDPLFPNPRAGWHQRPLRAHCQRVFASFNDLDLKSFAGIIKALVGDDHSAVSETVTEDGKAPEDSAFARRLITGLAAEHYFEAVQGSLPQFRGYTLENTTRFGCGYDFRLRTGNASDCGRGEGAAEPNRFGGSNAKGVRNRRCVERPVLSLRSEELSVIALS